MDGIRLKTDRADTSAIGAKVLVKHREDGRVWKKLGGVQLANLSCIIGADIQINALLTVLPHGHDPLPSLVPYDSRVVCDDAWVDCQRAIRLTNAARTYLSFDKSRKTAPPETPMT